MAEGSTASPTSIPNRRSSIRRSGVSSSPPSSLSSQILPPRSRAMTAGELHNAMEQEQEVAFLATRSSISFILPILLIFLLVSLNHTLSFLLFSSTFVFPLLRHILLFLSPFLNIPPVRIRSQYSLLIKAHYKQPPQTHRSTPRRQNPHRTRTRSRIRSRHEPSHKRIVDSPQQTRVSGLESHGRGIQSRESESKESESKSK